VGSKALVKSEVEMGVLEPLSVLAFRNNNTAAVAFEKDPP
jgi:hypothetical protein